MRQESGDDLPGSHKAATGSQSVGCISVRILDPLTSSESCQQNLVPCSCRTEGPTLLLSPGCCSAVPCIWPLSGPLTTWGLPTSRPAKDSLSPWNIITGVTSITFAILCWLEANHATTGTSKGRGLFKGLTLWGCFRMCLPYSQVFEHCQHPTAFQALLSWDLGCWPKYNKMEINK